MKKNYIKPIIEAEQMQGMILMQAGSPGGISVGDSGTGDIDTGGSPLIGG